MCEMCGKRTEQLIGKLVFFRYSRSGSQRTVWSKWICKNCVQKASSFRSRADEIQEKMEMAVDSVYLDEQPYAELDGLSLHKLPNKKGKKKKEDG